MVYEVDSTSLRNSAPRRTILLGATGTIGRATARALASRGYEVVCVVRPFGGTGRSPDLSDIAGLGKGATVRFADVTDPGSLVRDGVRGERFDAIISCLASRTGVPHDAWAIDYEAHVRALAVARDAGIGHFVLLSAICVQKPRLAFQYAKLAFEGTLAASGLTYSIVRPTAYFKSLAGQVDRVKRGKPFVMFGDGKITACKPISEIDLGEYLVNCLEDPALQNRILPIGGPGDAITPRDQGEELFRLLGRRPRFKHVPLSLLDAVSWGLGAVGRVYPAIAAKAELARIGRYYATESMLVVDPVTGRYDSAATPSTGTKRLFDYYARLLSGEASAERGGHAVF